MASEEAILGAFTMLIVAVNVSLFGYFGWVIGWQKFEDKPPTQRVLLSAGLAVAVAAFTMAVLFVPDRLRPKVPEEKIEKK